MCKISHHLEIIIKKKKINVVLNFFFIKKKKEKNHFAVKSEKQMLNKYIFSPYKTVMKNGADEAFSF